MAAFPKEVLIVVNMMSRGKKPTFTTNPWHGVSHGESAPQVVTAVI
jgi:hypothetical protein